jgi:hypothetical protein
LKSIAGNLIDWFRNKQQKKDRQPKGGNTMYDQKELCDRIKSLYPEMGECGIEVKVGFDEVKKVWTVELDKGAHHLKTYLEPMDAENCMEGKQCVSLGLQIAQLAANIKTVG